MAGQGPAGLSLRVAPAEGPEGAGRTTGQRLAGIPLSTACPEASRCPGWVARACSAWASWQ